MVAAVALDRNDVVCLYLHSAEAMTDAAAPAASRQQVGNFISYESHGKGVAPILGTQPLFHRRRTGDGDQANRRAATARSTLGFVALRAIVR
jgi:hypothetical protein